MDLYILAFVFSGCCLAFLAGSRCVCVYDPDTWFINGWQGENGKMDGEATPHPGLFLLAHFWDFLVVSRERSKSEKDLSCHLRLPSTSKPFEGGWERQGCLSLHRHHMMRTLYYITTYHHTLFLVLKQYVCPVSIV